MRNILISIPGILALMLISVSGAWSEDPNTAIAVSPSNDKESKPELSLYGRLQTQGFIQSLKDEFADNTRLYLFVKQARVGVHGVYEDIKVDLQIALGGEDEVKAPSPGISLTLLDLNVDFPLSNSVYLRVGQFKVPYGREGLTNSGSLQFTDRSIQFGAFKMGRDAGFVLHGYSNELAAAMGVFTGGGRDVPIRIIPQDIGFPVVVVRVGMNNSYDEDIFTLRQTHLESGSGTAFFVNALYTKDSKVGHSTALNVKMTDKSLLLNSNWNPYIGKRPFSKGKLWQVGADFGFKTPLNESMALRGEAEGNYGVYKNEYGRIKLLGGRTQLTVYQNPFEVAVRYAFLKPDENFAMTDNQGQRYSIVDNRLIHEVNLAISYFIKGERLKLTADLPILFGAPVVMEPNIGAYVLTQHPDQASYVAAPTKAPVERQTVLEARMQLQYSF